MINQTISANKRKNGAELNIKKRSNKVINTFSHQEIKEQVVEFIKVSDHPCLSAQSVVNNDSFEIGAYRHLGTAESAVAMAKDLTRFIKDRGNIESRFASFLAVFQNPGKIGERSFELLLWKQLSLLNAIDVCDWDETVSSDPEDPKFSFSFGGKAFYIIGLHPGSGRLARQFPYPTLVFNLHEQFEALRADGYYDKMRDMIRTRDKKLQGSVNEMVADHGISSEAKQYSGRKVDESWKCPFLNNSL